MYLANTQVCVCVRVRVCVCTCLHVCVWCVQGWSQTILGGQAIYIDTEAICVQCTTGMHNWHVIDDDMPPRNFLNFKFDTHTLASS